ncbi:MAG: DUF2510 domain-containing protein [Actinomycetes bacterium]
MSAPVVERKSRPLIWWGAALLVIGVLGGVIAVVGLVSRVGGVLVDAITADSQLTPARMQLQLDGGPYVVYELTGQTRGGGPFTVENGRGVTVNVSDVTVTSVDGTQVPVGPTTFTETITQGSSNYTGVARFDVLHDGTYVVEVATPGTRVLVAPSVTSGFRGTVKWFALGGVSGLLFLVGVVLLIVGIVRSRKPRVVVTPPGWYQDPQAQASWRWWDGNAWTDRTG